jgi:hypothetical protein
VSTGGADRDDAEKKQPQVRRVAPDAFHSDHGGWRDQAMPAQRGGQALDKCGEQRSVGPTDSPPSCRRGWGPMEDVEVARAEKRRVGCGDRVRPGPFAAACELAGGPPLPSSPSIAAT